MTKKKDEKAEKRNENLELAQDWHEQDENVETHANVQSNRKNDVKQWDEPNVRNNEVEDDVENADLGIDEHDEERDDFVGDEEENDYFGYGDEEDQDRGHGFDRRGGQRYGRRPKPVYVQKGTSRPQSSGNVGVNTAPANQ